MNIELEKLFAEIGKLHLQIVLLQEENVKLKTQAAQAVPEKSE